MNGNTTMTMGSRVTQFGRYHHPFQHTIIDAFVSVCLGDKYVIGKTVVQRIRLIRVHQRLAAASIRILQLTAVAV
jgi:hypothetical protein